MPTPSVRPSARPLKFELINILFFYQGKETRREMDKWMEEYKAYFSFCLFNVRFNDGIKIYTPTKVPGAQLGKGRWGLTPPS